MSMEDSFFSRWSQNYIPTLRETPAEAEAVSHQLMLRAGMIRKLLAGAYVYLPLGWRSLFKAIQIVREEMNRAGAQELLMPSLQPAELWRQTGRYELMKEILFSFDRPGQTLFADRLEREHLIVDDDAPVHLVGKGEVVLPVVQLEHREAARDTGGGDDDRVARRASHADIGALADQPFFDDGTPLNDADAQDLGNRRIARGGTMRSRAPETMRVGCWMRRLSG
jgi:hypothetical protein